MTRERSCGSSRLCPRGARIGYLGTPLETPEKQCRIGFQPVSGQATRHPQKSAIHAYRETVIPTRIVLKASTWRVYFVPEGQA